MRLNTDTMKAHDASCVCPACLGLECLERPRYFSGQLLTEAELNSEQAYILAKNRLHNRYLHGSGIVCGLQISCSDCEGVVTIQSGYAIDPCGNDIIVCDTQDFDVIKRIRECDDQRKRRRKSDCDPVRPPADKNCKDIERHYCLTVAYQEIEARPINALRKTSTTSSTRNGKGNGCGCNSSQSGNGMMSSGSGTSYATSSSTTMQTVQSNMPIGCEPTRIFEGYRFDVVEVPPDYCENLKVSLENTLLGKIIACLTTLRAFLDKRLPSSTYTTLAPLAFLANTEASPQELYESCCRLRQAVYDLYLQDPLNTHCTALDILTQVVCQPPSVDEKTKKLSADVRESYIQQVRATLYQLLALLLQYTLDCICNALMPPCPLAPAEDRLILACLTVKDDKLVEICDFCQRRYAGSFPSLYYWLSLVPIVPLIAYAVERICCYDWLKLDFTNAQGDQQGTYGGNLMNRLTLLLDRIDPSGSLRKAIFAENFAWPRSYASRFEQIIQNISPSKITDVLHPENFNMSTIVGKPVKEATAAMNKAGVTPIVREVASVNEMPLLSNLAAPPFARSGDQVVVYKLGDNVVGYAAYTPSPSEVSEIKNDVARLSDELSKAAQPAAVQPQPEVTAMQETINTLQVDLAALKNEVEKLKAGGAQPPSEPPKA